jgi:cytochrome c biogenesis protein CcmG/thiol:disulfide interchange protein DsbE
MLVAIALLAVACVGGDETAVTGSGSPATNAASAALLPQTTAALPEIDVDSFGQLLTQLHGTPVVVNLWAAWCEPCKVEGPLLADAARTHGAEVQFVGIDSQDSRSAAQKQIAQFGWSFPSLFDPAGAIQTDLGMVGLPGTFFYAADGTLVNSVRGQLSAEALAQGIEQIRG